MSPHALDRVVRRLARHLPPAIALVDSDGTVVFREADTDAMVFSLRNGLDVVGVRVPEDTSNEGQIAEWFAAAARSLA